jgi:hypothetical protein
MFVRLVFVVRKERELHVVIINTFVTSLLVVV